MNIFSRKNIFLIPLIFFSVIIAFNVIINFISKSLKMGYITYWPMSQFAPVLPLNSFIRHSTVFLSIRDVIIAAAIAFLFYLIIKNWQKIGDKLFFIILAAVILIIATNLIHGIKIGLEIPIDEGHNNSSGGEYYNNAYLVGSARSFLSQYEKIQPSLWSHAQTHPPGSVLLFYALKKIFVSPEYIALFIAIASAIFSIYFLYGLLKEICDESTAKYAAFLFSLIPAIQIYYLASLDALIASLLLGTLYFFKKDGGVNLFLTLIFLFLSSFLTFGFLFILPVLFIFEILAQKSVRKFLILIIGLAAIYFVFWYLFGFNYLNSFFIASKIENPQGFRLFASPLNYLFTRLEDILEIILFFGPFLTLLFIRGLKSVFNNRLGIISVAGIAILLFMFLSGAYRVGETARAAIFIYPYLMIPVALYFQKINLNLSGKIQIATLVFAQTLIMQLFGFYGW